LSVNSTGVTDLSPLADSTNLTYLSLSGNPITNYDAVLPGLTSLTSLYLADNAISNLIFLENLTQLTFLAINNTRVADVSPLVGLTNLSILALRHNFLTNIVSITSLPRLSYVDVSYNLLNTDGNSASMTAIQDLQAQGVDVSYVPQREPPSIEIGANWSIRGDMTALLFFDVLENVLPSGEQVMVTGESSNT